MWWRSSPLIEHGYRVHIGDLDLQGLEAYAPATLGHSTCAMVLGVDDVDAVYAAAVAAGATADREPSDQGDEKRGWLVDPFGHRWAIHSTPH